MDVKLMTFTINRLAYRPTQHVSFVIVSIVTYHYLAFSSWLNIPHWNDLVVTDNYFNFYYWEAKVLWSRWLKILQYPRASVCFPVIDGARHRDLSYLMWCVLPKCTLGFIGNLSKTYLTGLSIIYSFDSTWKDSCKTKHICILLFTIYFSEFTFRIKFYIKKKSDETHINW